MKQFNDSKGGEWEITLNVLQFKRCRDMIGFDLSRLTTLLLPGGGKGKDAMAEIVADPILFVDIVYCLCKDQIEKKNMTGEDFGRLFDGETIDAAINAFLDELANFFPEPGRSVLQGMIARAKKTTQNAIAALSAEKIEELLNSAMSTPESSE